MMGSATLGLPHVERTSNMSTSDSGKHDIDLLTNILSNKFDLRQKYENGKETYYRLWQTVEVFNPYGDVVARNQWRGDFHRVMELIRPSGKIEELVTWHSVGVRNWSQDASKYE